MLIQLGIYEFNKNATGRVGFKHEFWLCFVAVLLSLLFSLALALSSGWYQGGFCRARCHMQK